ncbi:H-2 class I histocompatibility antigen, Q10 alpha chain-like [Tautogolabrus adspersus]
MFELNMCVIAGFVLMASGVTVTGETHSLIYTYTAFSKPVGLPGIHTFTAMGLLDNIIFDYYDSESQKKVSKHDWMKEPLPQPYWDDGTKTRHNKQKWLKENIEILMARMNQSSSDIHVLQWRHGCKAKSQSDGTLKFTRGYQTYNYDGKDFISFDVTDKIWVSTSVEAEQTKWKWNHNKTLIEYTSGYLQNDCIQWLSAFMKYWKQQLVQANLCSAEYNTQPATFKPLFFPPVNDITLSLLLAEPPKVLMFAKNSKVKKNVNLNCLATGFLPKDIELKIKREGRVLTKDDGVTSTGPVPNGDDTFQRRDRIEILRDDLVTYTCEVSHTESNLHNETTWDKTLPPPEESGNLQETAGGVVGGLLLFAVLLVILWKRRRIADFFRNIVSSKKQGSSKDAFVI